MNQYLLSVHYVEGVGATPADEMEAAFEAVNVFNEKIMAEGIWVFGGGLHPPETATVVRNNDGEVLLTDGPFAESKEQLGGFWVIKAPDLDAAVKLAAEASGACRAPVEVRPFQDEPDVSEA